jgi:hypothetical protein
VWPKLLDSVWSICFAWQEMSKVCFRLFFPCIFFTFCFFEGVTGFLRLFFENDSLFAACNFVRNFPRFKQPEDTVRVSFCPLVGYGNGMWFDDEVLRKSEGVIFVHHVQRDLTAEFLHWRKRIGNARAESKGFCCCVFFFFFFFVFLF